jgi:hypothetical protein
MRERLFNRLGVLVAAAAIIACGWCPPAIAQEAYVGASYLSSNGEFETSLETFNPDAGGWKIFGGYNFNKFVGLELTYYDLGTLEDAKEEATFSADVSSYDLALKGILPLGKRFELNGKLGYAYLSIDSTLVGPAVTTTAGISTWELIYGVGVAFKVGQRFGIRAEWEVWNSEDSIEAYSIGAYYRFGKR